MPRKGRIDHKRIKAEVAKYTAGGKTWKVMACGHREWVFMSVDEKTEVCRLGLDRKGRKLLKKELRAISAA